MFSIRDCYFLFLQVQYDWNATKMDVDAFVDRSGGTERSTKAKQRLSMSNKLQTTLKTAKRRAEKALEFPEGGTAIDALQSRVNDTFDRLGINPLRDDSQALLNLLYYYGDELNKIQERKSQNI